VFPAHRSPKFLVPAFWSVAANASIYVRGCAKVADAW
jgi:hypothetical protein